MGSLTVRVTRPVEPELDDRFWQELVFNQHDEPDTVASKRTMVLENPRPNFYLGVGDPGSRIVSDDIRNYLLEAIPRLAEQLTGEPYRGRIEEGSDVRERSGWIAVEFLTRRTDSDLDSVCGRARVGADPGRIWINMRRDTCSSFEVVLAHELGHAFGFRHVASTYAAMHQGLKFAKEFSVRESYHARLAYDVGRGVRYNGWPFSGAVASGEVGPMRVEVVDD